MSIYFHFFFYFSSVSQLSYKIFKRGFTKFIFVSIIISTKDLLRRTQFITSVFAYS